MHARARDIAHFLAQYALATPSHAENGQQSTKWSLWLAAIGGCTTDDLSVMMHEVSEHAASAQAASNAQSATQFGK
eukprot:13055476-Alexandrium_andersonii.AAC.1